MKMTVRKVQILRRIVQLSALVVFIAVPVAARYGNYLAARELDKNMTKWDGSVQGEALHLTDIALRSLPGGEKERVGEMVRDRTAALSRIQSLRGGPWSLQFGSLSMTDPLAAAESVAAHKTVVKVLLIGVLIPLVITLLLGRVFCSWVCPMGLLLEMTDTLRGMMRFLEIRPRDVHVSRMLKYLVLSVGLVMAALFSLPILGYIYPPAIIGREIHDFVFGLFDRAELGEPGFWAGGLTWMSLILVGIALVEITVSRRWWCRYMCPGGGLYSLIGAFRPFRIKLTASNCTKCGECVKACPMGLLPMQDKMGVECDNCGVCISHCNDDALGYGLGLPRKP